LAGTAAVPPRAYYITRNSTPHLIARQEPVASAVFPNQDANPVRVRVAADYHVGLDLFREAERVFEAFQKLGLGFLAVGKAPFGSICSSTQ
jgi:hypothetical protein